MPGPTSEAVYATVEPPCPSLGDCTCVSCQASVDDPYCGCNPTQYILHNTEHQSFSAVSVVTGRVAGLYTNVQWFGTSVTTEVTRKKMKPET